MAARSIDILLIEDNPDDVVLFELSLSRDAKTPYTVKRADRLIQGLELLSNGGSDVVLLDLGLPDTHGLDTFQRMHAYAPAVPIIVLTGHDDDDIAIKALQKGAQDYLVKGKADGVLLWRSIRYAIERQKLLSQLEQSAKEIKTLRSFLPICAECKKIRDDKGYWTKIETYISQHSGAEFSHGLCPECAGKLYPDVLGKGKQ